MKKNVQFDQTKLYYTDFKNEEIQCYMVLPPCIH